MPKFKESLIDPVTGLNSLDINDSCSVLSIIDYSNYDTNTDPGHTRADFSDYRKITITTPTGSPWVMSTIAGTGVDQVIATPSSTTDSFSFILRSTDDDGIYSVHICSYPTYNNAAAYLSATLQVVYFNGKLYKCIQDSTGNQPDVSSLFWEVYSPTEEEELLTKYCTVQKICILCININACYEKSVLKAFCTASENNCNDNILCKNPDFLKTMKILVALEAVEISAAKSAWDEVQKQVDFLKTICNC